MAVFTAAIYASIKKAEACWNAGDIPGFCSDYAKDVVVVTPEFGIQRGREQVEADMYKSFPQGEGMGTLHAHVHHFYFPPGSADEGASMASVVVECTVTNTGSSEKASGLGVVTFVTTDDGKVEVVHDSST